MQASVALLRGVNLAGHHRIGMVVLRDLASGLGLRDVRTHLNSGNLLFTGSAAGAGPALEGAIERRFGFRPAVILRTAAELRGVVRENPFAARPGIRPGFLVVAFLADDPGEERRARVACMETDPEELRIAGRHVYIYFANGMGRSKLTVPVLEKALGTNGTTRNWNTVTRLLEMLEEMESRG